MGIAFICQAVKPDQFKQVLSDPDEELIEQIAFESEEESFESDSTWHCIHFLLTGEPEGTDDPLSFIQSGGQTIDWESAEDGTARAFTHEEVSEIELLLSKINLEEMEERFDPDKLEKASLYRSGTDWDDIEEDFEKLRSFLAHCKRSELPMIAWFA